MQSLTNFLIYLITILVASYIIYSTVRILFYARRAVLAGKRVTPASRLNTHAQRRILVIGDSTAYGTGAENLENSLVGRLTQDFYDFEIINYSENGIGIDKLTKKLSQIEGQTFDAIIIHIGGIDTIAFTRKHTIETNMKKICEQSKLLGAEVVILVSMNNVGSIPLMQFPLNILYTMRSRNLTALFSRLCHTYGVVHVPLYKERSHEPLLKDGASHFSHDNIHPNDEGYGVWYKSIKSAIDQHLIKLSR